MGGKKKKKKKKKKHFGGETFTILDLEKCFHTSLATEKETISTHK